MWYTYIMEYYSAIKEWKNPICSNMDKPRDYHIKWSKPDWEIKISSDITYMQNLKKKNAIELIHKMEIDPQTQKKNLWLPKEKECKNKIKSLGLTYTHYYIYNR